MVQQYLSITRRWLWLLLLASLSSGVTAYMIAKEQPPTYQASARLIVGPGIDSLSPGLDDLRAAAQLMQSYAELATTRPVLQRVIDTLDLSITPAQLVRKVETQADETTQILTVSVQSDDAVQTANIANTVADILVSMSPSGANGSESQIRSEMRVQIEKLEQEITRIESTVARLNEEFQATNQIAEKRLIADQITEERTHLADARRTLASLYDSFQGSHTNQIKVIETAFAGEPLDSGLHLTVLMGALAGLVLALAIAVAFEYFKGTIDTGEELAHITRIPVLGSLAKYKPLRGVGRERLVVLAKPESRAAESYRMLASKLLLSKYKAQQADAHPGIAARNGADEQAAPNGEQPLRSVLISGTYATDDTSEIAANLAVVLAQMRHRVILVDAHLHRPTLHQIFGLPQQDGLTGTLTVRATEPMGTPIARPTAPKLISLDWALDLSILPGGPVPPNPFELLVSTHMAELIEELEEQADIVLITVSPLLSFAESLILASRVDGVILAARSGKTHRNMLKSIVESLRSLDVQMIGAILDHNSQVNAPAAPAPRKEAAPTEYSIELARGTSTSLPSVKS